MVEVLDDFDAFGGGGGAPVPSWDTLGIGAHQKGVILPQMHPKTGTLVAYLTTQQTSMPEHEGDIPQPLTYKNGDPRLQAEFLVQTEIRDFSDCSRAAQDRLRENEVEDDGIRRVIVKGGTGSKSMQKNGRAVFGGMGRPEYGAYIDYTLLDRRPNKGKPGKENITECAFAKADAASQRIVHDYIAENYPDLLGGGGADAFSGDAGSDSKNAGDDPEF